MNWRFINTGFHSADFNMKYDLELAERLRSGQGVPTVRVYGWRPPALSLGAHQSFDDVDLKKAADCGVDVVRRPTGGRAILHANEATYSVVLKERSRSVSSVYEEISRAVVCGLRKLGVEAEVERGQPHFPSLYQSDSSAVCFSSSARSEIQVLGRKMVGSAQRRYSCGDGSEVVLQHGSILLGPEHMQIVDLLRHRTEGHRKTLQRDLEEKTIDLSTILGEQRGLDEVADALRNGFQEAWGIRFEEINETDTVMISL